MASNSDDGVDENPLSIILRHSLITCLISQNLPSEMSFGPLHTSIKSIHTRVGYVNEITDPSFRPLLKERSFEAVSFVCMKAGSHKHGDAKQCSPTDKGLWARNMHSFAPKICHNLFCIMHVSTLRPKNDRFFWNLLCNSHEQLHWYQADYLQQGTATIPCLYNIRNILGF